MMVLLIIMMAIIRATVVASHGVPTERQSQFIRRPSRICKSAKKSAERVRVN